MTRGWKIVASIGVVLAATALFTTASLWATVSEQSGVNNRVLCALRIDLERRVASGDEFLRTHPEGFAGLSAASIAKSVNDQRRTIEALSELSCS